jgi:hypothetical protein
MKLWIVLAAATTALAKSASCWEDLAPAPGGRGGAALSPDGKLFATVENGKIALLPSAGGASVPVTSSPGAKTGRPANRLAALPRRTMSFKAWCGSRSVWFHQTQLDPHSVLVIVLPHLGDLAIFNAENQSFRHIDFLASRLQAPEFAEVGTREWNAQHNFVFLHDHVFEFEMKVREAISPHLHSLHSGLWRQREVPAPVVQNYLRRKHLVDQPKVALVPDILNHPRRDLFRAFRLRRLLGLSTDTKRGPENCQDCRSGDAVL